MNTSFHTAKMGLISMQKAMDITANNIGNVETNGFKPLRASFSDLLYTAQNPENLDIETGHGARIAKTDLLFDVGIMRETSQPLDVATPTEGMFAFLRNDAAGTIAYSKDGSFQLMNENDTYFVVNSAGDKLLDYNGQPIIGYPEDDGLIDPQVIFDAVGVYTFPNPYGLVPDGRNEYLATAASGEAVPNEDLEKKQGWLETSSSDLADQMTRVIEYQRSYSFNAKMIQAADEMENVANNFR